MTHTGWNVCLTHWIPLAQESTVKVLKEGGPAMETNKQKYAWHVTSKSVPAGFLLHYSCKGDMCQHPVATCNLPCCLTEHLLRSVERRGKKACRASGGKCHPVILKLPSSTLLQPSSHFLLSSKRVSRLVGRRLLLCERMPVAIWPAEIDLD